MRNDTVSQILVAQAQGNNARAKCMRFNFNLSQASDLRLLWLAPVSLVSCRGARELARPEFVDGSSGF
jgi:hypothetical protein